MENKQPREYDAVLGGQVSPPSDAAVLGGIEGAKQRLVNGDENYRILALSQLINYGNEGLDLVIKALKDSSEKVQLQAYKLLRDIPEAKVRESNTIIYVWKSTIGKNIHNFAKVLRSDAEFVATTLDWKTLIGCGGKYSNECYLMVWDFVTGKHLITLSQRAYSAAISADGQTIGYL